MGLAIILGAICAGIIGLLLWARGAIAAAERRHAAQVRANELYAANRVRRPRDDAAAPPVRPAAASAYAKASAPRSSPSAYTPRTTTSAYTPRTSTSDVSSAWSDFGSSSDSYSSGGSCSSGGGDSGGGGCD